MAVSQNRNRFLDFLYQVYREMDDQQLVMVYEGEITHSVMKSFSSLTEETLIREHEPETVQRKLYHVIVESLQNINHHAGGGGESNDSAGRGAFILCYDENYYYVLTGNLIPTVKVEKLTELMDRVNAMDEKELAVSYKKQLLEGHISAEGGAGLGFIDLRRKTGEKVGYRFLQEHSDSTYYFFTIKISRKEQNGNAEN